MTAIIKTLLDYDMQGEYPARKDVPEGPQGPVNPTALSGTPQDIKISKIKIPEASEKQKTIKSSTNESKALKTLNINKRMHRDRNWLKELPRKIRDNMDAFVRACESEFPDDRVVKMYARMFEDGADERLDRRKKIDKRKLKNHERLLAQRGEGFGEQYRARIAYVMMRYVETKYPGSMEALR